MRRLFPSLACVAALLLVAAFLRALMAGGHGPLGWASVAATVTVHAEAFRVLADLGGRVETAARQRGLPDWVGAMAERNRRKGTAYQVWGLALIALAAWIGKAPRWHLAVSASALAFQLGAFVGESLVIAGQDRLLREVEGWAAPADAR